MPFSAERLSLDAWPVVAADTAAVDADEDGDHCILVPVCNQSPAHGHRVLVSRHGISMPIQARSQEHFFFGEAGLRIYLGAKHKFGGSTVATCLQRSCYKHSEI